MAIVVCLLTAGLVRAGHFAIAAPQDVGMSREKLALVGTAVQELVDTQKIAGASVLVSRRDKVVLYEAVGMMDREAGRPITRDTLFRIYSMTKPVTSVALMMLVEAEKIKLDDPVSEIYRPFKGLRVYDASGVHVEPDREMTVRDLLRHTSGLTYGFFGNTPVDRMYRERGVLDRGSSLGEMAKKLSEIALLYQPGTRWHYSVSTDMLGFLVEKVSGETLDMFFKRRIFTPLGMHDTAFHVPADKAERLAVCYGPRGDEGLRVTDDPRESEFLEKPGLLSGGGGLVSTLGDYLQFCRMLLNRGTLNGRRLLRPETVEMMTRNQLPESTSWNEQGFGLGFSVQTSEGNYGAGEYGWGGAASTHFWIHPDHELIVIALSQRMPFSNQLQKAVKDSIYRAIID
jgi:CubicO group peptidase (beta-lactamase class C family)